MKTIKIITILLLISFLNSCSKSLVYSPSVNLPHQLLKKDQLDIGGGIELLPETRPERLSGESVTFGMNGQIAYGFSDRMNLTLKGWLDLQGRESSLRSGLSLHAQFIKKKSGKRHWVLLPRAGFAMSNDNIRGYGLSLALLHHEELNENLGYYFGTGLAWGARYLSKDLNDKMESKLPMGFGGMMHAGFSWAVTKKMRLNVELSPIFQIQTFDKNQLLMFSPQVGFAYRLR